jgi:excinuclease UvrABC nuclease subunit
VLACLALGFLSTNQMKEHNIHFITKAKDFPSLKELKEAHQLTPSIYKIVTADDLLKMAQDGLCPHYILQHPITKEIKHYFKSSEIHDWLKSNYMSYNNDWMDKAMVFHHFNEKLMFPESHRVPLELSNVDKLFEIPRDVLNTPPGVYFLCHESKIVYIGMSTHIGSRIMTHSKEGQKVFDAVYFITCGIRRVAEVETALIRYFKPKYNFDKTGERDLPRITPITDKDMIIVKELIKVE